MNLPKQVQRDLRLCLRFFLGEIHSLGGVGLWFGVCGGGFLVAAAAVEFGEPFQVVVGEADLYVSAVVHDQLDSLVSAVSDQLGEVVIRLIRVDVWDGVIGAAESSDGPMYAPRAAVALDLMDSGDPRHWVAAEYLISAPRPNIRPPRPRRGSQRHPPCSEVGEQVVVGLPIDR